jgi:hypothetical protein
VHAGQGLQPEEVAYYVAAKSAPSHEPDSLTNSCCSAAVSDEADAVDHQSEDDRRVAICVILVFADE